MLCGFGNDFTDGVSGEATLMSVSQAGLHYRIDARSIHHVNTTYRADLQSVAE